MTILTWLASDLSKLRLKKTDRHNHSPKEWLEKTFFQR